MSKKDDDAIVDKLLAELELDENSELGIPAENDPPPEEVSCFIDPVELAKSFISNNLSYNTYKKQCCDYYKVKPVKYKEWVALGGKKNDNTKELG